MELILFIKVRQLLVALVPGDIIFVTVKRPYTSKLQDTLISIHHSQLIPAHQFFSGFLVI